MFIALCFNFPKAKLYTYFCIYIGYICKQCIRMVKRKFGWLNMVQYYRNNNRYAIRYHQHNHYYQFSLLYIHRVYSWYINSSSLYIGIYLCIYRRFIYLYCFLYNIYLHIKSLGLAGKYNKYEAIQYFFYVSTKLFHFNKK